jgi:hypothetical protein
MPTFTPNASKITALMTVLPKDDYEFIVGQPKPYSRTYTDKEGNVQPLVGVGYPLRVAEGTHKDERLYFNAGTENDISMSGSKRFLMACLGFKLDAEGEQAFNEKYSDDAIWTFDPDSGAVGDIWREVVGKRVVCGVDIRTTEKGTFQSFKSWRSINA